jgi:FkbM family methyltransferase
MEFARRLVRRVVGYDSRLYRAGAEAANFLSIVRREGLGQWRALKRLSDPGRAGSPPEAMRLRSLAHPILIRPGTHDAGTVINNIVREEYGHFPMPAEPKWLIDAGAYIGDTCAYFLSKFPALRAIALEPNPSSYEIARENLKPYGERAVLEKLGLYSEEKVLFFAGDGLEASISTSGTQIACTTLAAIMARHSITHVDILKLDIEGAEDAIFRANPEAWLGSIGLLILEIHGPQILSLISDVLGRNGFSMKQYRSLWYCRRTR